MYLGDCPLEGSWIVIHIVTPKTKEAHKDEHEVAVNPCPGVAREKTLQGILLHWDGSDGLGQFVMDVRHATSIC